MQTNFILLEDLWSGFFSTIFEVFGIMVGIGIVILILFFLIDSIQHKSKLENFKFEDLQRQITNSKHKKITQLNEIEKEIDDLIKNMYNPSNNDNYDQVESIKRLQSLLSKPFIDEKNIWKLLSANYTNPYKNILSIFNKKIS